MGMETIISSAITAVFALIGVIITSNQNSRKIERKLEIHQAVTDQKIEDLTREVREHNNFAKRMPALEQKVAGMDEKINYLHKQ